MSADEYGRVRLGAAEASARRSAEIVALRFEVAGLRRALETRAPIEQAKGMLMMRHGLSAEAAFELLARWSSDHRMKLRTVASRLVDEFAKTGDSTVHQASTDALLKRVLGDSLMLSPDEEASRR